MPGQNIDGRSSVQEVAHHLLGHLARIGADSLVGDAVIGGKDVHRFTGDPRRLLFAPGHILRGHGFQLSQTAQRLGQAVQVRLRLAPTVFVEGPDAGNGLPDGRIQFHRCS